MREQKLQSSRKRLRLIIAVLLLMSSVAISVGFSIASQHGNRFWVAREALIPGTALTADSLELRRFSLGASSALYFNENDIPLSNISKRFFAPGEVIARSGVSEDSGEELAAYVPLSIRSMDIPDSAQEGDLVTLFWVLDGRGEQLFEPEEIARDIYIRSIDRRGSNFGSDLAVSVTVSQSQVQKLLSFTSGGRIVVVPNHG